MDQLQQIGPPSDINLRDIARGVWRRKWLVLFIMIFCLGAAVGVSLVMRKKWQATAQLVVIQRAPTLATTPEAGILSPIVETPESQQAMLMSDGMAKRTLDWLRNDALYRGLSRHDLGIDDEEQFKQDFTRLISVDAPKETNVLMLSAIGTSPDNARALANAVCQAFVQWKRELAQQSVQDVTDSLNARLRNVKAQLETTEAAEAAYKKSHHIIDLNEQQKGVLDDYLARDNDVQLAKQDVASQEARLQGLTARMKDATNDIKTGQWVRDDQYTLLLQQQLNKLEMDRADLAQKVEPGFPGTGDTPSLAQLDAQIQEVKTRLEKAVQTTLNNKQPSLQAQGSLFDEFKEQQVAVMFSRAKLAAAINARDQLKQQTNSFPQTSLEYEKLVRNADIARNLFATLSTDLNVVGSGKEMATSNVQIAQPAIVPETPYRPNWFLNLALGCLLGIFFSLATVLLIDQNDKRVRDIDTVKRLAQGPIVGMLPSLKRSQLRGLLGGDTPAQAIEAYGLTRANLAIALGDGTMADPLQNRVILVTSAVPGEGKSVTAASLARSLARADKNVILVDADMRRPTQNRLFGIDEPHGLADVLAGSMSLDEALLASDTEHLILLPSGAAARNPSELLSLPRLSETLNELRGQADVVLIDAPTSSAVADALFIARHVDCILHVVGAGRVDEDAIRESAEVLDAAAHKPIMFFINRAPKDRKHTYRSYYTYGPTGTGSRNGSFTNAGKAARALRAIAPAKKSDSDQDKIV